MGLASCGINVANFAMTGVAWACVVTAGAESDISWRLVTATPAVAAAMVATDSACEPRASGGGRGGPMKPLAPSVVKAGLERAGVFGSLAVMSVGWAVLNVVSYGIPTIFTLILEEAAPDMALSGTFAVSFACGVAAFAISLMALSFLWRNPDDPANAILGASVLTLSIMAVGVGVCYLSSEGARIAGAATVRLVVSVPSCTFYAYPVAVAPPDLRSAAHGSAAAVSKVGALLGQLAFYPLYDVYGFLPTVVACLVIYGVDVAVVGAGWLLAKVEGAPASQRYSKIAPP